MFTFKADQKEFEVSGVKIGGHPGLRPTVLIGTIFYHNHKIVEDPFRGEFDRLAAEKLINLQDELSDKTGNPCMLDVVGSTNESLLKFIDFAADVTDSPILLDGTSSDVRVAALNFIKQSGLVDRIIYNSLTPEFRQEELEAIRQISLKSAILLAYYLKDFTSKGRVHALSELLGKASEAGIEKPLLDTCVIDVPSLGQACWSILRLKDNLGYPVGCGAHNAISTWKRLRSKMGEQAAKTCVASAIATTISIGADFALYGPVEDAEIVFPAVAMIDAAYSQLWLEKGIRPTHDHPRFKIG